MMAGDAVEPFIAAHYTALILAPRRVHGRRCENSLFPITRVPSFCRRDAILEGYRGQTSFQRALASVWRFHNETISIWSHLIGERHDNPFIVLVNERIL